MANKNSTQVANFVASPITFNAVALAGGKVRAYKGTLALATGDLDANDTVMLAALPVSLRVHEIRLFSDDLDSNGTPTLAANVGLWTPKSTPVVKDADAYASAITLGQAAATAPANVAFEARDIIKMVNRVWEDAGDTKDPGGYYFLGLEWSTGPATAAAGDISWLIMGTMD